MARKKALVLIEDEQGSWGLSEKNSLQGIDDVKDKAIEFWNNEWVQFGMDAFYLALFVKGFQNYHRSGWDKLMLFGATLAKVGSFAAEYNNKMYIERKKLDNGR